MINTFIYICFSFQTYISCWSLFVLCNTALQVERQVVTADQDSLPELLFKLPHVWLNAREIQLLWKREMLSVNQSVTGAKLTLVPGRMRAVLTLNVQGLVIRYYLHHLCVRIQSEEFQASFTPHFGLNISGSLLKNKAEQRTQHYRGTA